MLEICFNDSVEGALKIAQNCSDRRSTGICGFAIITEDNSKPSFFKKRKMMKQMKKEQDELQKRAVSLGGSHSDVLGLDFHLSEGDILSPVTLDVCPRKEELLSISRFNASMWFHGEEEFIQGSWAKSISNLKRLKKGTDNVRIWIDSTPDAQCGLLFVADLLKNSGVEIHIVQAPDRYKKEDNLIVDCCSWGEIPHELYGTFLDRQRQLSEEEIQNLSSKWKKLQSENSPLRVIEDNEVISAKEDYYDNLIRAVFPKASCSIGTLIVDAMNEQHILTGDVFIAKRIKHFIENGELQVISDNTEEFYGYQVKTANGFM